MSYSCWRSRWRWPNSRSCSMSGLRSRPSPWPTRSPGAFRASKSSSSSSSSLLSGIKHQRAHQQSCQCALLIHVPDRIDEVKEDREGDAPQGFPTRSSRPPRSWNLAFKGYLSYYTTGGQSRASPVRESSPFPRLEAPSARAARGALEHPGTPRRSPPGGAIKHVRP